MLICATGRALAAVAVLPLLASAASAADPARLSGTIAGFTCGDNCYLTVVSASGEEHVGLCTAPECAPWNEVAEMPADTIGKKVTVTTATATQFDGNGTPVGEMLAFEKIEFAQ